MFRRRPRRRRPPGARPAVREALIRAHRALEDGDTARAAQIFLRLAEAAARRRMPGRAAGLLLEAAHAEALGGAVQQAVQHARRALDVFTQAPPPPRVVATVERLIAALRQGGHETEAEEIEQMLEELLQKTGTTRQELADRLAATRAQRRGRLPAKCTSCAGPLLPDEVEWHGADTAECPYCGSAVKTE